MKKVLFFAIISLLQADEYDKLVNQILNYKVIIQNKIYNPFETKKVNVISVPEIINNDVDIKLLAILNNKALLNVDNTTKWVKKGQYIDKYKVLDIKNNKVILSNGKILQFKKKIQIKVK